MSILPRIHDKGIPFEFGTSTDVQRALTEAYEAGDLRGSKLKAARALIRKRLIAQRSDGRERPTRAPLTGRAVVKEYQEHTRAQRTLIKRAAIVRERLVLVRATCRRLFSDENFVTLLRAEGLALISEKLLEQSKDTR